MRRRHAKEFFCVALAEKSHDGNNISYYSSPHIAREVDWSWVAVYVSLAESTTDNLTGQAGTTFRKNYQERKDIR